MVVTLLGMMAWMSVEEIGPVLLRAVAEVVP